MPRDSIYIPSDGPQNTTETDSSNPTKDMTDAEKAMYYQTIRHRNAWQTVLNIVMCLCIASIICKIIAR